MRLLESQPSRRPQRITTPGHGHEHQSEPRRVVRCGACGHRVAQVDDACDVGGKRVHTCVNPSGILYTIACYLDAPGCVRVGAPEAYWSWFPGHTWQIAQCARCRVHLGWHFRGGEGSFYGLIRDRLVEASEPPPSAP